MSDAPLAPGEHRGAARPLSLPHHSVAAASRRHLLTVNLEDYYHVSPFKALIDRRDWSRFERRVEIGTRRTLAMLDEYGARATFFTLGWVAERVPELVREVADRGHEVASKGYYHRGIRQMSPGELREDLARAREAIEQATGRRIAGYRAAERWLGPGELWVLDLLAEEGYRYDSSINPIFRRYAGAPERCRAHLHATPAGSIWEFPISSVRLFGLRLPVGGGNYLRQFPSSMMRRAIEHWVRHEPAPFVMYFHTWELDPEQPRVAASLLSTVRQYRNLRRMEGRIRQYLARYPFQSIAQHLDLEEEAPVSRPAEERGPAAVAAAAVDEATSGTVRAPVTLVVPCYNEAPTLPYLANTLAELRASLEADYALACILVDDGSRDQTWEVLSGLFGSEDGFTLVRHDRNRGAGPAIATGLRRAGSEIVCSMDCDCTYDPRELRAMIALLSDGVDMVTASPYHAGGTVRNVPAWRLALSRSASALYRLVLGSKLATYTSCFRVYRRSSVAAIQVERSGFLGIAEQIAKLELAGGRIVEHPTTLNVRLLGYSKMNIARTVLGHLGLLAALAGARLARVRRAPLPQRGGRAPVPSGSEAA